MSVLHPPICFRRRLTFFVERLAQDQQNVTVWSDARIVGTKGLFVQPEKLTGKARHRTAARNAYFAIDVENQRLLFSVTSSQKIQNQGGVFLVEEILPV